MMARIILPWPLAKLSPNERGHWRTKESAREAAKMIGFNAGVNAEAGPFYGPLEMSVEVHPPDKRRYDWDNIVGRLKYNQDGFCEALGINDNQIKRATVTMCDVVRDGRVIVTLRGLE